MSDARLVSWNRREILFRRRVRERPPARGDDTGPARCEAGTRRRSDRTALRRHGSVRGGAAFAREGRRLAPPCGALARPRDRERAREALDEAASMRETLERFGPQRLMWLRLESEFNRRSGNAYGTLDGAVSGAASVAREAAPRVMALSERGAISVAPRRGEAPVAPRRGETPESSGETFITCDPRMAELLREIERAAHVSRFPFSSKESPARKDLVAQARAYMEREGAGALRAGERGRAPRGALREHGVRARAGRVHRRRGQPRRFRGRGGPRHALPRRDRGAFSRGPGEAPSSHRQARIHPPRRDETAARSRRAIVAATNRDLKADCASGRLRADLYYRLAPLVFRIPPLRERQGDIARLARHFADRLQGAPRNRTRGFARKRARRAREISMARERPRARKRDSQGGAHGEGRRDPRMPSLAGGHDESGHGRPAGRMRLARRSDSR